MTDSVSETERTYDELAMALNVFANADVPMKLSVKEMRTCAYALMAIRQAEERQAKDIRDMERMGWIKQVESIPDDA